jgi:hypothetical protein
MKKEIYSFKFRFVALVVLLAFTAMSCSLLGPEEPEEPDATPVKPKKPLPPTMFYLTTENEISQVDMGRTGFAVNGGSSEDLLTIAEELQDGRIAVRFIDTQQNSTISLYFSNLAASFPSTIAMKLGVVDITGTFGSYHDETETFLLTLFVNDKTETLEGLVLNKNVLTMYQDEPSYSPSLNARIRDYLIAMAVWVPIYQRIMKETSAQDGPNASLGLIPGIQYSFFDDIWDGICTVGEFIADVGEKS